LSDNFAVLDRYHLDVVRKEDETVWFTLIVDDPVRYYVEQYHESNKAFRGDRTLHILPEELARHRVNDRPLIKLVENKLQELVEISLRGQAATTPG
jgi:hypothetical protein